MWAFIEIENLCLTKNDLQINDLEFIKDISVDIEMSHQNVPQKQKEIYDALTMGDADKIFGFCDLNGQDCSPVIGGFADLNSPNNSDAGVFLDLDRAIALEESETKFDINNMSSRPTKLKAKEGDALLASRATVDTFIFTADVKNGPLKFQADKGKQIILVADNEKNQIRKNGLIPFILNSISAYTSAGQKP